MSTKRTRKKKQTECPDASFAEKFVAKLDVTRPMSKRQLVEEYLENKRLEEELESADFS